MKKLMFAGLILSLFVSFGCSPKNEFKAPPPPQVTVKNPEQKTVTVFVGFPGRLVAHDDIDIRPACHPFDDKFLLGARGVVNYDL